MAADSTVNIDVVLGNKDRFISDSKEVDNIGQIVKFKLNILVDRKTHKGL